MFIGSKNIMTGCKHSLHLKIDGKHVCGLFYLPDGVNKMQLSLSCHARQVCLRRLITGFSDVIKLSDVTNL